VRPEDAGLEREFVRHLSSEARYFRFFHGLSELSPSMLVRFTQIDYDCEMAFSALYEPTGGPVEQVGSARYVQDAGGESCEFALVIADAWQRHGLGGALMRAIIEHARDRGLLRMHGDVLAENHKMLRLMQRLDFTVAAHDEDATLRVVTLKLNDPRPSRIAPQPV
jgi:acetyltransferase